MHISELEKKVIAAARAFPPSDAVPYAFEKRVMARLAGECMVDVWAFWGRVMWQAAAPCVLFTLVLTIWVAMANGLISPGNDLAVDLERTYLEPLARMDDSW